jgi:hypothetical protein
MDKSIYQIENEYQLLINQIIEAEGEITPQQELNLQITKEQLQSKGINYAYVIRKLDFESDVIDAEIKRLSQLKKVRQNLSERLKANITHAMHTFEVDKIESPLIKISFRKSQAVEVGDVNSLPSEYKVVKVTEQADKIKIKQALQNGEQIQGCSIITNTNLQIK